MALLLGIDFGTSYFKVGLFDESGLLKGLGRVPVDPLTPAPGRYEVPVEAFWDKLRRGLQEALTQAGASAKDILALSYSSQANTFLLLDRNCIPLTPLVLWTDSRADALDEGWKSFASSEAFRRHIGFEGISGGFAVAKWRWFEKNEPAIWARVERFMTISDYFTFALTGERVGDASTAAFLGLCDLSTKAWWPDALAVFGVDPEKLSKPLRPGSACGVTTARAAEFLGLPPGIPVAVGGLDHHIAAVGSGVGRFADLSISTGTVLAALALVDEPTPKPGCYHGLHVDGRRYYRLSFDPNGAGQLEDYQRRFAPDRTIEQLIALAADVPPGTLPKGKPARGQTDKDHAVAVRYLLEKIAATHRRLAWEVADPGTVKKIVATGGGARSPLWLQIKADMLDVPIVKPSSSERACLGAAAIAAAAAGCYPSIADATLAMVHAGDAFQPNPTAAAIYRDWTGQ